MEAGKESKKKRKIANEMNSQSREKCTSFTGCTLPFGYRNETGTHKAREKEICII